MNRCCTGSQGRSLKSLFGCSSALLRRCLMAVLFVCACSGGDSEYDVWSDTVWRRLRIPVSAVQIRAGFLRHSPHSLVAQVADRPEERLRPSQREFHQATSTRNAQVIAWHDFQFIITGGSRGGQSGHGPHPVCQWDLAHQSSKILPHKNDTHHNFCLFCLLSTLLNFRTHKN